MFLTPLFATHPSPPGVLLFRFSTLAKCSSCCRRHRLRPTPLFLPMPYPLPFHILAHSFALFCTRQRLNSFVFNRFRTLCQEQPGVGYACRIFNPLRARSSTSHATRARGHEVCPSSLSAFNCRLSTSFASLVRGSRNTSHESPVTAIHGAAVLSFGRNLKLIAYD